MKCNSILDHSVSFIQNTSLGYKSNRNKEIVLRYYGLEGGQGCSMAEVGSSYNLGRERVRQILNDYKERLQSAGIDSTILSGVREVLKEVSGLLPAVSSQLSEVINERFSPVNKIGIDGFLNLLELIGVEQSLIHSFEYDGLTFYIEQNELGVHCADISDLYSQARKLLISEVSKNGAVSFNDICSIKSKVPSAKKELYLGLYIEFSRDFVWLDSNKNWIYRGGHGRNKALSRLAHLFSVYKKVTVSDVKNSLSRSLMKGVKKDDYTFELDNSAVLGLCRHFPGISVSQGIVTVEGPVTDPSFSKLEKEMVRAIRQSETGEVNEKSLEDALVHKNKRPQDKYAFSMVLNYSPLIIKERRGIYRLAGELF